ncbi:YtpI family protein [Paenibacillus hexagrammi]|uniref:YtpI family protein n=1 Tax=Paenibacillus hexagrammi TaxID=2908839 RepID=A0ABY3SMS7_9BACL|nr:YtpI family protein [Paenibacillus sp. YPD9-1]UJF34725.1 YtpI family protein [Paenibacillus sp. YPD9-1]
MLWIRFSLFALILITLVCSVYFSIRSRRAADVRMRGLYASRMNISMGLMLAVIAVTQLFFFQDSSFRRIFGTVCLLLGLFNLFAGIRNHGHFERLGKG